jgi:heme/copper-type cytochrome/quinol oxidase subunit 3
MTQGTVPPEPTGDYLTGEAEAEWTHQQMWGAYWTGARLLVAGSAMAFGCLVFAYFYLRDLNSDGLWYLHGEQPSLPLGALVLSFMIVSAALVSYSTGRLRRTAGALDWMVGAGTGLGLGILAIGFLCWQLATLPFYPGETGYASVFVGWQPVLLLSMLGGVYWLETLITRGVRVRRVLSPLPISATERDVTMFRGSLDGFVLFWNFTALVEIVSFILFYAVH